MAAVACAKRTSKCVTLFCTSTILHKSNSCRTISSLVLKSNKSEQILQNPHIFKKSVLVNNYYVKKKEKNEGPSSAVWAALGGVTCGIIISAIFYLGMN